MVGMKCEGMVVADSDSLVKWRVARQGLGESRATLEAEESPLYEHDLESK